MRVEGGYRRVEATGRVSGLRLSLLRLFSCISRVFDRSYPSCEQLLPSAGPGESFQATSSFNASSSALFRMVSR